MTTSGVDILIPVYNAEDTLEESLRSVAAQTHSSFRVIVIDDGSTDRSGELLDQIARNDPRFLVVRQNNAGIVAALNRGLALVDKPYVARMDADDLCNPERLASQVAYLGANPDCIAVGCRVVHIDEHGETIRGLPQPGDPGAADPDWIAAREPYIVHPFLMVRTDALRGVGGYRPMPHSEDSDLCWRLCEKGRLHNLPDVLGQYRFHIGSISGSSVLNGRIMAIGSQLAALCARRRRDALTEPDMGSLTIAALRQAGSLSAMLALVEQVLEAGEIDRFRLCVAIKLLELANYRPYELELEDCRFVAQALKVMPSISLQNALDIRWYVSQTTARMVKAGALRKATTLAPVALWPRSLYKSIWR